MRPVIVVSEVRRLRPEERWSRLIGPLGEELESSGLGRVLDLESLRQEAASTGTCLAEEVAVELVHNGYGRELVRRLVAEAGVENGRSVVVIPVRWRIFPCEDYYSEGWAERGYFDEEAQVQVIATIEDVYEDAALGFLVVGHPGVDGIRFGYRRQVGGLWGHEPIRGAFRSIGRSTDEVVRRWQRGELVL